MRGDLGTLGVILGATIGVREMNLLIIKKEINFWRNVGYEWHLDDRECLEDCHQKLINNDLGK